jgi:hypothetical protein
LESALPVDHIGSPIDLWSFEADETIGDVEVGNEPSRSDAFGASKTDEVKE